MVTALYNLQCSLSQNFFLILYFSHDDLLLVPQRCHFWLTLWVCKIISSVWNMLYTHSISPIPFLFHSPHFLMAKSYVPFLGMSFPNTFPTSSYPPPAPLPRLGQVSSPPYFHSLVWSTKYTLLQLNIYFSVFPNRLRLFER